jgi:hypothetical protein
LANFKLTFLTAKLKKSKLKNQVKSEKISDHQ